MAPTLSQRARITPPSPIRKLAHLAQKARGQGTKVLHLNIGQPDLIAPPTFLEAMKRWTNPIVAYESSWGNDALRERWVALLNRSYDLSLTKDDCLVTMGASEALVFAFMVIADPGDELLVFDPTYANYLGFAAIAGVTLVPVPCSLQDGYALPSVEEITKRITPRTKGIILCNPNNPTGTVYTHDELLMVLSLAEERKLFLVVDETYREFVYDGEVPRSIYSLSGRLDNIIVVDSLSKRFSLCGARVGCFISTNQEVMQMALHIAQARLAGPTIEQGAAAEVLTGDVEGYINGAVATYRSRRDVLVAKLSQVPEVITYVPKGAFYSMAELPVDNAESFCRFMLEEFSYQGHTVFLAPAAGFYMEPGRGTKEVRLAYVLNETDIECAIEVIAAGLVAYEKR